MQDQINQLESKVDRLLRRLEEMEIEVNELKSLNTIVSGIETEITEMKDSISTLDCNMYRVRNGLT